MKTDVKNKITKKYIKVVANKELYESGLIGIGVPLSKLSGANAMVFIAEESMMPCLQSLKNASYLSIAMVSVR
jgi:hypothetical protein